jgi:amidase
MNNDEYQALDGLRLAALLRAGEVTPAELMDCSLDIAEQVNPQINALCHMDPDLGRRLAGAASLKGRFGALPMLLKDSGLAAMGLPQSLGSRLFAGLEIPSDATVTDRLVADGFLPFGRTTAPEFSMAPTTEARANGGPTRNPWNLNHSTGGSSGGAAAAVAAGILPVAHGSDGGGSIRIPASCCGLYGLKPSRGLVPAGPSRGEGWGGLASDGVLSRSVRDTAAALDGIAGADAGAPYAAPAGAGCYLAGLESAFDRPQRVAMWTRAFDDIPLHPDCLTAVRDAAQLLEGLGHEVVETDLPPIAFSKFVKAQIDVMAANAAVLVNGKVRNAADTAWQALLEPAILDAWDRGRHLSAEEYILAVTRFHTIGRQMEAAMTGFDFILTPTLCQPPLPLGQLTTDTDFVTFRTAASRYTTFLAIINASGQPAASLPLSWNDAGLPIGVQLVGHFGAEADLLRLSAQIETARPWFTRRPAIRGH